MKSILSFISGIVLTIIVFLAFGHYDKISAIENASSSVHNQIAVVNLDTGIEGQDINLANSMINNLYEPKNYELISTTYTQAKSGVEENNYAAYIMFDAEYSNSILSAIRDEIPSKAKIQIKINNHLTDQERTEVINELLREIFYINNTTNYLYMTLLLDTVHTSQEEVKDILDNEDYVNEIITGVNEYNERVSKNIDNYINNPQDIEIEIDTALIDEIFETNLKIIRDVYDVSTEEIQEIVSNNQTQLNNQLAVYKNNPDIVIDSLNYFVSPLLIPLDKVELNMETSLSNDLLTMINENIEYGYSINQSIDKLATELEKIVDEINKLPEVDKINTNILTTIFDYVVDEDIDGLETYINTLEIVDVLNDFNKSYVYWVDNPDSCSDTTDSNGCMRPFINKYDITSWATKYVAIIQKYESIKDYPSSRDFIFINSLVSTYMETLTDDYKTYVDTEFEDLQDAYRKTTYYCLEGGKNNITKFACNWKIIVKDLVDLYGKNEIIVKAYNEQVADNKMELLTHNASIARQGLAIDTFNQKTLEYVMDKNLSITQNNIQMKLFILSEEAKRIELIQNIEQPVNSKIDNIINNMNTVIENTNIAKDEYATNKKENVTEYQSNLNESIDAKEEAKLENSKNVQTKTSLYKETYPLMDSYLEENKDNLAMFEDLMSNTKNANGANYYIYDYLVNPIKVTDETGKIIYEDETKESSFTMYILIIIGLIILILGLIYLYYLRKKDE